MKSIRIMIFGIGLFLVSIFCRLMTINRNIGQFWSYFFPIGAVIVGIICLVLGLCDFFDEK